MNNQFDLPPHSFHIPVMGTGFTIDTPLKVARFGISSVMSLVDDLLLEQMRQFYCEQSGEPYEKISPREDDSRAKRVTAYLNLVDILVARQSEVLQASPFEEGSEITRYYRLLPDGTPRKLLYKEMLSLPEGVEKSKLQAQLRSLATPGSIDVNIMSKVDRDVYLRGKKLPVEYTDAVAALRGYANSTLRSSIVFSAGMNPRLYGFINHFDDFLPQEMKTPKKKVILKVSDYRSAMVQGKYLAKRGVWVSEYRIESGLNCGGHAFASTGFLMGPILEEFKIQRESLLDELHTIYTKALKETPTPAPDSPLSMRVTVQGGIGNAFEDSLLRTYYGVDGTGWATPFLLVPEVTNVDEKHLIKLEQATEENVHLSDSSPFGVPFWNLKDSESEEARRKRLENGKTGSPCPKGHVRFNTEFTTVPLCTASQAYQKLKLKELDAMEGLDPEQRQVREELIVAKSCICHDLAGVATKKYGIDKDAMPAITCGPNIVNFSQRVGLDAMIDHIYGRGEVPMNPDRPHFFIKELMLYVDYLRDEIRLLSLGISNRNEKYFQEFRTNLLSGIEYYKERARNLASEKYEQFYTALDNLEMVVKDAETPVTADAAS